MNWGRAYFGLIIVTLGTLLLLDNLDVLEAGQIIGEWWPLAIVVGGILAFIANPRHWLMPVILVVGGAAVLLNTTGVVDIVNVLFPALVIVVGLLVIFGRGAGTRTTASDHRINTINIFSDTSLNSDSQRFEGGKIGAVFGGAEIDLSSASLAAEASLDVFAAFGVWRSGCRGDGGSTSAVFPSSAGLRMRRPKTGSVSTLPTSGSMRPCSSVVSR